MSSLERKYEKVKIRASEWNKANADKCRAAKKKFYAANRDHMREYNKKYQLTYYKRKRAAKELEGKPISLPEHWGGYLIKPTRFEFWQGRENRLHDRFQYLLTKSGWELARLSP